MRERHLLGLRELEISAIQQLLDDADAFVAGDRDAAATRQSLRGRTVVTLFYEPSTRTELAFEIAGRRLGAEVVRCDVDHSSVRKGESLVDTGRTLEALGGEVIVLRHPSAGACDLLARTVGCGIINAGDGMHEHPTQGLIDVLTVRQLRGRIAGLRVAIVGDIMHSRVARSALWGFSKLGAQVTFVGPPTLLPAGMQALGVETVSSLRQGLDGVDVVMALRMQCERQRGGDVASLAEYARDYKITSDVLVQLPPEVIVLHPGPVNLGVELDAAVAYGPQSALLRQVANGIAVRMAALQWVLNEVPSRSQEADRRETPLTSAVPANVH